MASDMTQKQKQELLKKFKDEAMTRLMAAVEQDKRNSRTKKAREAREAACIAVLVALRAADELDPDGALGPEVKLNPENPLFEIFIRKHSWRNTMRHVCEQVANPSTKIAKDCFFFIKSCVACIPKVGTIIRSIMDGLIEVGKNHGVDPFSKARKYNEDLWYEFFDDIPRDGGDKGPKNFAFKGIKPNSIRRDLHQLGVKERRWKNAMSRFIHRFGKQRDVV